MGEKNSIVSVLNSRKVFQSIDFTDTWVTAFENQFSCPGSPGPQRNATLARRNILKFDAVTPIGQGPLLTYMDSRLDKIVVEVLEYQEDTQEIIFFTTDGGDIRRVIFSSRNPEDQYMHLVSEANGTDPVRDLVLHHRDREERSLLASRSSHILQFQMGQCYCYADCFTCFSSKDPYCSWNTGTETCINKLSNPPSPSLVEIFSASEAVMWRVCGLETTTEENCTTYPTTMPAQEITNVPVRSVRNHSVLIGIVAGLVFCLGIVSLLLSFAIFAVALSTVAHHTS